MRFGEIDIPDEVIAAQKNGSLVVFAGAGVSIPSPSKYPSFRKLAARIVCGRLTKRRGEPEDHYLGRARKDAKVAVHSIAKRILSDPKSRPNSLHRNLVGLFRDAASIRLVTTNVDEHLTTVGSETFENDCETYYAPALPLGREFTGIVYLHGSVAKAEDRMVLTDDDFGRAYLTDGWATSFLKPLFEDPRYVVLFIGYSFSDPVVPYLARGLSPEGKCRRFAFVTKGDEERWHFLNINPLPYQAANKHQALQESVAKWVENVERGALDHEVRVQAIVSKPPTMSSQDCDYLLAAIRSEDSVQFFVRHAKKLDWLKWAEENGILDPLFTADTSDDSRLRCIAYWLADNFLSRHSEELMALIQRKRQRISATLWQAIAARLAYGSERPSARVLSKWVSVLLATPVDVTENGVLSHMMSKLDYPDDMPTALMLFDHLCEPRLVLQSTFPLFDDREDPRLVSFDIELLGSAHSLWKAWKGMLLPHLDELAERLEPILTRHIQQAYLICLSDCGEDLLQLRLGLTRPSITSKPQHRRGVDVLIDAESDLVEWMAANKPGRAMAIIDAWSDTAIILLRRLALHGLKELSSLEPGEKIQWILNRRAVEWVDAHGELLELLTQAYSDAPAPLQKAFLQTACAGIDGTVEARPRARRVYYLLDRLAASVPGCPLLAERVASLERFYPKFRRVVDSDSERAAFSLTADELLANEPGELLSRLLDERGDISDEHEHAIAQALPADLDWGLRLARSLAAKEMWDTDIWFNIIGAWRAAPLRGVQWDEVLTFFADNPALYQRYASSVSGFLKAVVGRKAHRLPISRLPLAEKVARQLWTASESLDISEVASTLGDWCTMSLGHPGGDIAEFWMWAFSRQHTGSGSRWKGIPRKYKLLFSMILDGASHGSDAGRVRLAGQFSFLYAIDKKWSLDHILHLFDWDIDEKHAEQAWQGFSMWGRLTPEVVRCLEPYYRKTFARATTTLGISRENFAADVATISLLYTDNPLKDDWLTEFIRKVGVEDREHWTHYVGQILEGMKPESQEGIWNRWLKDYWQRRIDGVLPELGPKEIESMIWWSFYLTPVFAEVVDMICKVDAPATMNSFIYNQLVEKGCATIHPIPLTLLLRHLLKTAAHPFWDQDDAVKLVHSLSATDAPRPMLKEICDKLCKLGVAARNLPQLS